MSLVRMSWYFRFWQNKTSHFCLSSLSPQWSYFVKQMVIGAESCNILSDKHHTGPDILQLCYLDILGNISCQKWKSNKDHFYQKQSSLSVKLVSSTNNWNVAIHKHARMVKTKWGYQDRPSCRSLQSKHLFPGQQKSWASQDRHHLQHLLTRTRFHCSPFSSWVHCA